VSIAIVVWLLPRDPNTQAMGANAGGTEGFAGPQASGPMGSADSLTETGETSGADASDGTSTGGAGSSGAAAAPGGSSTAGPAPAVSGDPLDAANCDRETGRVKIPYNGAPPCVPDWPAGADNGGDTAPGVTPSSVKVIYVDAPPAESCAAASTANAALGLAGDPDTLWNTFRDAVAVFQHVYQTYGRKVSVERYRATGCDEAAQRADAVAVAARKPFITFDHPQIGPVFDAEIANRGVINVGWNLSQATGARQSPYRYGHNPDFETGLAIDGEFVGKSLAGRRTKWAGDATMNGTPRRVGLVVPNTLDPKLFTNEVAKYGGRVAEIVSYKYNPAGGVAGDPASYQQEAPIVVSKLKAANITTVVIVTDFMMTSAILAQSTSQVYRPEWVIAGFQYQDYSFFARTYDQSQMAHAFGVGLIPIAVVNDPQWPPFKYVLQWYYGSYEVDGGQAASVVPTAGDIFIGIHLAGPTLTPQSFQKALFTMPPYGGYACKCKTGPQTSFGPWGTAVTPQDFIAYDDVGLLWWDGNAEGPTNGTGGQEGRGNWQYLLGSERFVYGKLPTGELPFFDAGQSVVVYNGMPPSDKVKNYPCENCPSTRR
jgi:hypothetical protein